MADPACCRWVLALIAGADRCSLVAVGDRDRDRGVPECRPSESPPFRRLPSVAPSARSRGGRLKDCDPADGTPAACIAAWRGAPGRCTAGVAPLDIVRGVVRSGMRRRNNVKDGTPRWGPEVISRGCRHARCAPCVLVTRVRGDWCARVPVGDGGGRCGSEGQAGMLVPTTSIASGAGVEQPPSHRADFVEELQGGCCVSAM
jgi:hypothetical protein